MPSLAVLRSGAAPAAFAAGLTVSAFGLALIWLPLGLIAGGLALAYCAVLYERGKTVKPDA